ncbi:MAG: hypothetical protein QXM96_00485 [Candidatus Woesearchaeota archaeon]
MCEKFYEKMIALSYYIKNDKRFDYYKEYVSNLSKTKEEIKELQLNKLKKLVKHAYETVPYYKELFDRNKINPEINSFEDFKKIPELEKKTVLEDYKKLLSNKKYKLIKQFSGGSTGNKVTIYKNKEYYERCAAVWLRDLYSVGITPGMKSAWVWGNTSQDLPFKKRFFEWLSFKINRRIMFNTFRYTDDDIEKWITKEFNKFKPDYMYGYAGIIYDIAKCIKNRNLKIHQLKKIVTTSERLEHREFIEEVFNCKIHDQYGCSEVNSVAIENENGIMHVSDDFVVLEINKNNEILLTPLESYGMPLLRYKVGDVGIIEKTDKKDKSPFGHFSLVVGRIYEILLDKNGKKVSGGLIKQRVEDEDLEINEFQVVQKSFEEVDLNVVKDKFTTEKAAERTAEILKEELGCKKVNINYMDKYPAEPNGKRIAFKCMIKESR